MTDELNLPVIEGGTLTVHLNGGVYWRICGAVRQIAGVSSVTVFGADDDVARMQVDLDPARDVAEDGAIADAIVALLPEDAE